MSTALRPDSVDRLSPVRVGIALIVTGLVVIVMVAGQHVDAASLILIAALPLVPIVVAATVMAARGCEPYAFAAVVSLVVIQGANLRFREAADKSINWQVAVKLAGLGLLVVVAMPTVLALWRRVSRSQLLWCALLLYLTATSVLAPDRVYSLVASASVLATWLFLVHLVRVRGTEGLAAVMLCATLVLATASLVAYVALPDLGRMSDWVDGAFVQTSRLQGVIGSANAAGISTAMGLLLLAFVPHWRKSTRWIAAAIFLICLVASHNRMALACTLLAMAVLLSAKWRIAVRIALLALALGVAVIVADAAGDRIAAGLARSGSAEEVMSLTGRTRIWAVALELWAQAPLTGHGYASALRLLPTHPLLFEAAAHTHNLYVEVLFSGGLIGFGLLLAAITACVGLAVRRNDPKGLALLTLFLVYGLTEPIMSTLAGLPTAGFLASMLLAAGPPSPSGAER